MMRGIQTAVLAAVLLVPGTGRALNDLFEQKLFGRWNTGSTPSFYYQGYHVLLNEKWAVMSSEFISEGGGAAGGVHVYNAVTGAFVRKLNPPGGPVAGVQFGYSLALSGDLLAVGCVGFDGFRGRVFVFDLKTGVLKQTLSVAGGASGDSLGVSVAIAGRRVLAAAPGYNASRGAVYVYDIVTGAALGRIDRGGSAVASDRLGVSVAAEGALVLIGAPGVSSSAGAAYLFNAETLAQVFAYEGYCAAGDAMGQSVAMSRDRLFVGAPNRNAFKGSVFWGTRRGGGLFEMTAPDAAASDSFGHSVAADAGMLLVGAYGCDAYTGAGYLYESNTVTTPVFVRRIQPRDAQSGSYFGISVSLCGSTAMMGAYDDDTQALGAGAAYLMRPLIVPLTGMTKVAAKGEFAPGVPEATFNVMSDASVNGPNRYAFSATLAGAGSNGGKDSGVWTNMDLTPGNLQLALRSRQVLPAGEEVVSLGVPFCAEQGHVLMPVTMKVGTGTTPVTAATAKWLMDYDTAGTLTFFDSTGRTPGVGTFAGSKTQSFVETVQGDRDAQNHWATTVSLLKGPGLSTTATNDSGVLIHNGAPVEGYREGADAIPGGGEFYGQFTGRVSLLIDRAVFSAATAGPAGTNQIIVHKGALFGSPVTAARKGDPAPESLGSPFLSSFLGESSDGGGQVLYRATLAGGTGLSTANNEGIWLCEPGLVKHQILRKGQTIPGTALTVGKILGVWGGQFSTSSGMAVAYVLVQLKGAGVTPATDQALLHVYEGSTALLPNIAILLREGDPVEDAGTGTIAVINRVIAEGYQGGYLALVTLAGAPKGTELAVLTGRRAGNATTTSILRRPIMYLRKGWLFDGQPGRIKSFSVPANTVTPGGFGATGRPSPLGWSFRTMITVEFENGVRQIMDGYNP